MLRCVCTALFLASGVIVYVSALNDEVSYRKRPLPGVEDEFTYTYGWAFLCAGVAFLSVMLASVINVTLFVSRRHYTNKVTEAHGFKVTQVNSEPRLVTVELPRSPRMRPRNEDKSHVVADHSVAYNLVHSLS